MYLRKSYRAQLLVDGRYVLMIPKTREQSLYINTFARPLWLLMKTMLCTFIHLLMFQLQYRFSYCDHSRLFSILHAAFFF
jgi:hypothetical protein